MSVIATRFYLSLTNIQAVKEANRVSHRASTDPLAILSISTRARHWTSNMETGDETLESASNGFNLGQKFTYVKRRSLYFL